MPYMRHGGTLDYTVTEEIEPVIRDYIPSMTEYHDLVEQYDDESCDEALEGAMSDAVDLIHADLSILIGEWIERHGNQIIGLLDPSEYYEEEEEEEEEEEDEDCDEDED